MAWFLVPDGDQWGIAYWATKEAAAEYARSFRDADGQRAEERPHPDMPELWGVWVNR